MRPRGRPQVRFPKDEAKKETFCSAPDFALHSTDCGFFEYAESALYPDRVACPIRAVLYIGRSCSFRYLSMGMWFTGRIEISQSLRGTAVMNEIAFRTPLPVVKTVEIRHTLANVI